MGVTDVLDCEEKFSVATPADATMPEIHPLDVMAKGLTDRVLAPAKEAEAKEKANGRLTIVEPHANGTLGGSKAEIQTASNGHLAQTDSSSKRRHRRIEDDKLEVPSMYWSIMSYISYICLVLVGYLREFVFGIGPIGEAEQ